MSTFGIRCGAIFVTLWSAVGCGGAALSSQDGEAGPLATCGDNCSAAEVSASCSAICNKIAQTGCPITADCSMSCAAESSMTPSCAAVADGYLRCIESSQPTCSDSGMVRFVGCDAQQQALQGCIADGGSSGETASPDGNGPGASCNVPANVCPKIPRPTGGAGASSCSGGGGGGPNGPTTSQTSCQDSAGNVWQSECTGSTCTCAYNGGQACTCTMTGDAGSCSSCCPGTG